MSASTADVGQSLREVVARCEHCSGEVDEEGSCTLECVFAAYRRRLEERAARKGSS